MSPILWRDPSGHDFESTGAEGWFLRNSDELMVGAAVVTVSALTFGTADAVFALTGSAAVALGAAGGVGVLGAEGFNQFRSGCFNGWDLADADGYVEANLWTGIGRARSGCGAAIVGDPDQVVAKLREYEALGIDSFILSGYPHREECELVGRHVLPAIRGRTT